MSTRTKNLLAVFAAGLILCVGTTLPAQGKGGGGGGGGARSGGGGGGGARSSGGGGGGGGRSFSGGGGGGARSSGGGGGASSAPRSSGGGGGGRSFTPSFGGGGGGRSSAPSIGGGGRSSAPSIGGGGRSSTPSGGGRSFSPSFSDGNRGGNSGGGNAINIPRQGNSGSSNAGRGDSASSNRPSFTERHTNRSASPSQSGSSSAGRTLDFSGRNSPNIGNRGSANNGGGNNSNAGERGNSVPRIDRGQSFVNKHQSQPSSDRQRTLDFSKRVGNSGAGTGPRITEGRNDGGRGDAGRGSTPDAGRSIQNALRDRGNDNRPGGRDSNAGPGRDQIPGRDQGPGRDNIPGNRGPQFANDGGRGSINDRDRGDRGPGNNGSGRPSIPNLSQVKSRDMWNSAGRGVREGLVSLAGSSARRPGGNNGNIGNNGPNNLRFNNNFNNNFNFRGNGPWRSRRVFIGFNSAFLPYYAWNYRPMWGGWGGGGWGRGWNVGIGFRRFAINFGNFGWGGRRWWNAGGWGPGWGFGLGNQWGWGGGWGGGWGPGWGVGYPYNVGYYGYNPYCSYGWGGGYGYGGYGYGGYGYDPGYSYVSNSVNYATDYGPVTTETVVQNGTPLQLAQIDGLGQTTEATVRAQSLDEDDFAARGEAEFQAGQYAKSSKSWKHAVLDDPQNGVLLLLLSQSMFAEGKFNEAAGALQRGLTLEEADNWGVVVKNYREIYPNIGDYTTQLRVLEKARKEKTDDPALRFLLGYHYAYLGYPEDAVTELDKLIDLAPQDEVAIKLKEAVDKLVAEKGSPTVIPKAAPASAPTVPLAPPVPPQP